MITANRTVQILLLYLFIANMGVSLFGPIFAVFITGSIAGATLATAGFAVALSSMTKSIIQIPLARYLDKTPGENDEFYTLIGGSMLGTIYIGSLIFVNYPWQLYGLALVSGVADACLMAAYYALFSHHVDRTAQGLEWSLLSVIGLTASFALGGALGGILAEQIGFRHLFYIAASLNGIATLLIILLYPRRKNLKKKKITPTVSLKRGRV
ncbi:MAG: MFS transporter [Patescibacteria group bacterium]